MSEQWSKYKTYRNRLNYLIRAAERQYYQGQISKHKSNLKKSWQIIKTIINKSKYKPSTSEIKCNGKKLRMGDRFLTSIISSLLMLDQILQKYFQVT